MERKRLPISRCPSCGYQFDSATALENPDAKPKPGDLSICLNCGEWLTFADDLTVRLLESKEFQALPHHIRKRLDFGRTLIRRQPWFGTLGRKDKK